MSPEPRKQGGGGLSLATLLIAGAASATAAFVVPLVWQPGTVFAAAMTPIIVTVTPELLRRPADTVSAVAKRTAPVPTATPRQERFDPLAPPPAEDLAALNRPRTTTRTVHAPRRRLTSRQWRLALGTAVLAFVCAVAFVTASQLLAGKSIGGSGDNSTTFFNGSSRRGGDQEEEKATPSPTPSGTAESTRTPTPTATPSATATPTPSSTATPAPSAAPQAAPPAASPTPVP